MKIARLKSGPEIFYSLQGEGSRVGTPAVFVRLSGCNLHCSWCDTKYSWAEGMEMPVEDVASSIMRYHCPNLVLTGGEPLLQAESLCSLLRLLPQELFVEVETNGTLLPPPWLMGRVNQWNVSPKLPHAGNKGGQPLQPAILAAFADGGRSWFKFVIQTEQDWPAIEALSLPRNRIILMPCATTRAALGEARPLVARLCLQQGVRLGERLHLTLWDGKKGV